MMRRFMPLSLLIGLAALAATGGNAGWAAGLAVVANSGGASISLIDMQRQVELRRIPALREPHHLTLTPDHRTLVVGDTAGNELLLLDPATGAVRKQVPVSDPYNLGFSPDGKWLTVNGLARNQVDIYDAATMSLVKRLPLASMPSHLAYGPDSSMVYVTLQGSNRLVAIDLRRMGIAWNVEVGKAPAGVMWHRGKLLVADMGADYVAVVDPGDGHIERRIRTGRGAHQLFLSPDGKLIYVNNRVDGTTVALEASTLALVRSYAIPGGPDCIDFAPDGKLWITRRWAEKVAILDPATGAYQTVAVGRSPHGIWLNPHAP